MGVGLGLYMYDAENLEILWYDVVVKRSRLLSYRLMSSCYIPAEQSVDILLVPMRYHVLVK